MILLQTSNIFFALIFLSGPPSSKMIDNSKTVWLGGMVLFWASTHIDNHLRVKRTEPT